MKNIKIIITLLLLLSISQIAYTAPIAKNSNIINKKPTLKVILSPKQNSYKKMTPIKFNIKVLDKNKPIEKAIISMDLTMLDMYMPNNKIKFKEISKGLYQSEVMFTMSGNWKLIVTILNNNKKQITNFDVSVD
ncbi:MAG: FixH family protein [Candidatus Sericytochromatia bacterium]|nr:FixH family protein [Candidatus Sericytochromatia bacterium]